MSLLIEIDRYCRATGMPVTRFGRLAVHDPRLVHDLRLGRVPGPRLRQQVRAYIASTRP